MAEFVAGVHHRRAADLLDRAIAGRGAFRRFKDTLFEFPELREQWFRFRDARSRRRALRWLADEGLIERAVADRVDGALPRPEQPTRRTCPPRSPSTSACSTATGCSRCCCSAPGPAGRAAAEADMRGRRRAVRPALAAGRSCNQMDDVLWRHTERAGLASSPCPSAAEELGRRRTTRCCAGAAGRGGAAWR